MVTRAHCSRFVGQHVVFRTGDGMHHGILHSMTDDGIVVRPVGRTTRLASSTVDTDEISVLWDSRVPNNDVVEAWFPFVFFPFFALWWLWPWGYWW